MERNIYDERVEGLSDGEARKELKKLYEGVASEAHRHILKMHNAVGENNRGYIKGCFETHVESMKQYGIWQEAWQKEFDKAERGTGLDISKLGKLVDGEVL